MPVYNTQPPQLKNRNTGSSGINYKKITERIAAKKAQTTSNPTPITWPTSQPEEVTQGFSERLTGLITGIGKGIGEDWKKGGERLTTAFNEENLNDPTDIPRAVSRTVGTVAKVAFSPINRVLESLINKTADVISNDKTFQKVADTDFVGERLDDIAFGVDSFSDWAKRNPDLAGDIEDVVNVGLLIAGEKPAQTALQKTSNTLAGTLNKGLRAKGLVADTAASLRQEAPNLLQKGKEMIKPSKDLGGVVGEITQAKDTRGLAKSTDALADFVTKRANKGESLDIDYYKLPDELKPEMKNIAKQVDEALGKDTNLYKPKDLTVETITEGGQVIKTDYVSRALQHLDEIYTSVGDDLAAANIREAITKYVKTGFTKLDVNDLAKLYGEDAPKAFSKLGDALTSKTAQASESIRSGLKDVARSGMDDTAKNLDIMYSKYKSLEGYSLKMRESVQQLANKVEERGLLEKAGRALGQVADLTTGGFVKSFFSKFLVPSNVGQKTLNSLDLNAKLSSNLKAVLKLVKENDDEGLIQALKKIATEQPRTEVKQIKAPQFEQRSSFERSPIIQYIKDNPPNIGLSIRDVKKIDNLTKKEMIEIIDYARLNKDYNQSIEDAIGYLAEKFNLKGKNLDDIADELEALVGDTKTTGTVSVDVKSPPFTSIEQRNGVYQVVTENRRVIGEFKDAKSAQEAANKLSKIELQSLSKDKYSNAIENLSEQYSKVKSAPKTTSNVVDQYKPLSNALDEVSSRIEGDSYTLENIGILQKEMKNMDLPTFTKSLSKIISEMEGNRFASEGLIDILKQAQSSGVKKLPTGATPTKQQINKLLTVDKLPNGDVIMYHGTNSLDNITKTGVVDPKYTNQAVKDLEGRFEIFVSPDKKLAGSYGKKVVPVVVPKKMFNEWLAKAKKDYRYSKAIGEDPVYTDMTFTELSSSTPLKLYKTVKKTK